MGKRTRCIIALGNELREDDGVGLAVMGRLQRIIPKCQAAMFGLGNQLFEISRFVMANDQAVIIDAQPPAGAPGNVRPIQYQTGLGLARPTYSLHDLDLFWHLAEVYRSGFQGEVLLIGIEAYAMDYRIGLSKPLRDMLPSITGKVREEIKRFWAGTPERL